MAKPKKEFVRTEITVVGTGRFPIDMLRYDQCAPQSGSDASAIAHEDGLGTYAERKIRLCRYSHDGARACVERWRSFGWNVFSDTGVK